MNSDYWTSVSLTAYITMAITLLAVAILVHAQVQMNKKANKGKSR